MNTTNMKMMMIIMMMKIVITMMITKVYKKEQIFIKYNIKILLKTKNLIKVFIILLVYRLTKVRIWH